MINSGGRRQFSVIGTDQAGAAVAYSGTVSWASSGISATTHDTGISATFTSAATAGATGTINATIGTTACTPAIVQEFAPASGFRVVVVSDGATAAFADESPLPNSLVVVDDLPPKQTGADGVVTFDLPTATHTVSVFREGYSYVTIVSTAATDLIIPLKADPAPASFKGQLKDTDFANTDNKNGTLHLEIAGASLGGNLIDLSLSQLLGPKQPMTISLGTGTPYGPYDLPQGIALGLGATMFGDSGGGHYGVQASPGVRALWALGGNAVIGDVLKAIGPILNGDGGDISDQLPTILTALIPIIGALDSAVTSGVNVTPGDEQVLSFGGAQPSLKLDTPQRLHLIARTPALPAYVGDNGQIVNYDGVVIAAGVLAPSQGFVPLGATAGIDQGGPVFAKLPDHITDAVGTGGVAGRLPLRVAPRHGGIENAPWAFVTLGASIRDLAGALTGNIDHGFALSANVSRYRKGTTMPYWLSYNGGANTAIDLSDDFLVAPGVPAITARHVSLAADVSGAAFHRLDVGSDSHRWLVYCPPGTTSFDIPAVPAGMEERWDQSSPLRLESVSLGNNPELSWDGIWQFNGVDAADLSQETDRISVRIIRR